jgi:rsbT co-antagonist protein RsbR
MKTIPLTTLNRLLASQRPHIEQQWLAAVAAVWRDRGSTAADDAALRRQSAWLLDEVAKILAAYPGAGLWELGDTDPLMQPLRELSERRATAGFTPAEIAHYGSALKTVLTQQLLRELMQSPAELEASLLALDDVIGRLSLVTLAAFVDTREQIIAQQSLSLMELSTPVIRLWDHILLLPLIGVIDTARARKFTEDLLAAITRYEASVTLLDVTGVPVFDTAVARHLMKTVDAAQLLGTRVVMTGLSPEGALTLTKLGILLPQVVTRATLRSGVAEALALVGRRIVGSAAGPA